MKQSIVALIRPNLNFAQKENQAAHLIEHILVSKKRLSTMGISSDFYAKNIITNNGLTNDYFMAEYFIVRSETAELLAKILTEHQNNLHLDESDFEKIKSSLIEEISMDEGALIDTDEQLAKAYFTPDSPTVRNPWNSSKSIKNLTYAQALKIFEKYNRDPVLLNMSFDEFQIGKLPRLETNKWKDNANSFKLTHPWQSPGSMETGITIFLATERNLVLNCIYCLSLIDSRFGLLFEELRNKNGLVYSISVRPDYNDNTLEFWFSSSEEKSQQIIELIKISLENFDSFIADNLEHIKARLKFDFELDWGDIQNSVTWYINQAISGQMRVAPAVLIDQINKATADDLIDLNRKFLNRLRQEAIYTEHRYGKKLTTKISKKK